MILEAIAGLGAFYLTWSLVTMEINYRRASSMGIPLVRLPIDPLNLVWLILDPIIWKLLDRLPLSFGTFGRYSRRGWHFRDKAASHLRYGPVWALVTPRDIYVHVGDPAAIHDVFQRRVDFLRPSKMYKLLEIYGPCISTASPADWPRHRKVLAAPFNEGVMRGVWDEALKQTQEMRDFWVGEGEAGTTSVAKDTRTLSLNVLAATGFDKSYAFRGAGATAAASETQEEAGSYRDALQTVLDNAILLMLVPYRLLLLPFVPKSMARLGRVAADFRSYMQRMVDEETAAHQAGKAGFGGLMSGFVRALRTSEQDAAYALTKANPALPPNRGLTRDEILGNIFVINFAGHDTTANTLAFSLLLLAAHPGVQEWVAAEIHAATAASHGARWDYANLFPKLPRCRAVLYETLRLYPPIMSLPKWSSDVPQSIRVGERDITVPPRTGVMPSLLAVQTHPDYWSEPLEWKPARWIAPSCSDEDEGVGMETLVTPRPSTFFPWSDGPQNCPGERFAQVEFVAVLAALLWTHRLRVVRQDRESVEDVVKRVRGVTEDCDMELLLRMRDADRVRLRCERVEQGRCVTEIAQQDG